MQSNGPAAMQLTESTSSPFEPLLRRAKREGYRTASVGWPNGHRRGDRTEPDRPITTAPTRAKLTESRAAFHPHIYGRRLFPRT